MHKHRIGRAADPVPLSVRQNLIFARWEAVEKVKASGKYLLDPRNTFGGWVPRKSYATDVQRTFDECILSDPKLLEAFADGGPVTLRVAA